MALCGKNDALTAVTDKIADIEKEITAKLYSIAWVVQHIAPQFSCG